MAVSGEEQAMGEALKVGLCGWHGAIPRWELEADHAGDVEEMSFVEEMFTLCHLSQHLGCDGNEDIIKLVLKNCSKIVLKTCSIKQWWWTLHRRNLHLTRSYISSSAVAEGS